MKTIVESLEKLNFSKSEAKIYICLLQNGNMTGYQIGKKINMSRSSVYSSLENLYRRGIVSLLPGDTSIYQAQDPEIIIDKLKKEFINSADLLKEELGKIEKKDKEERFLNIEGYKNIVEKAKEILLQAQKEVYINTDFDLKLFEKELNILRKKGVRVIVFSFSDLDIKGLDIELYSHMLDSESCGGNTRLMIVIDFHETLIANSEDKNNFFGTFTQNKLLSSIVSEHIHNDIYILRLNEKYKKKLIDQEIMINTILEQRFKDGE